MTTIQTTTPSVNEVELTAFGSGYGECTLIHLGQGEWMVVDSCVARDNRIPVLEYLDELGVDAGTAVKVVVATHWHDDHIRGMSSVVRRCESALFVLSAALAGHEVFRGIAAIDSSTRLRKLSSGVRELRSTLDIVRRRGGTGARWAVEGRCVYQRDGRLPAAVYALSPADRSVVASLQQITQLITEGEDRRVAFPNRNLGAVALWVEVAGVRMLLGSDLQETANPETGWTAVIESRAWPGRAELFRVPCHGAANGHQVRVWQELLEDDAHAIVSPYQLGRVGEFHRSLHGTGHDGRP